MTHPSNTPRDQQGQGSIEYTAMIAVITLLIVPSFNELSFLLSHQFFAVSDLLYNTLR